MTDSKRDVRDCTCVTGALRVTLCRAIASASHVPTGTLFPLLSLRLNLTHFWLSLGALLLLRTRINTIFGLESERQDRTERRASTQHRQ